ncbi:MAG: hypothetical protein ABIH37_03430 [archaeon]
MVKKNRNNNNEILLENCVIEPDDMNNPTTQNNLTTFFSEYRLTSSKPSPEIRVIVQKRQGRFNYEFMPEKESSISEVYLRDTRRMEVGPISHVDLKIGRLTIARRDIKSNSYTVYFNPDSNGTE